MLGQLKEDVYRANMELPKRGLVTYTWGNVSGIDRGSGCFVIKPSGVSYDRLRPEDMVVVNLQGECVAVSYTHLDVYKRQSCMNDMGDSLKEAKLAYAEGIYLSLIHI